MIVPFATTVGRGRDLIRERSLVARLLPHLEWRRHGIGVLQAYLVEGDYEVRVHVWSRDLMLPGIDVSGNVHNHRFRMRSTVLLGDLEHVEYRLINGGTGYELYDFVHARIQTDANRSDMRRLPGEVGAETNPMVIQEGSTYGFELGAFHTSAPITDVVVTLVEKLEQRDEKAMVLAPVDQPPVPAFGGPRIEPDVVDDVLELAEAGLLELVRKAGAR